MLPPQVYYGLGVLAVKGAKWLFGGSMGGNGAGDSGFGGGDLGTTHEGWVAENDEYKWLAVPASRAHLMRISERVWSLDEYVATTQAVGRDNPQWRAAYQRELACLRQAAANHPGHVIFVVQVK